MNSPNTIDGLSERLLCIEGALDVWQQVTLLSSLLSCVRCEPGMLQCLLGRHPLAGINDEELVDKVSS